MATMPVFNNTVRTVIAYGDTAYASGSFTTVNGVSGYAGLAKFNLTTGVADTAWKPAAGNTPFAMALSSDGTTIFVGGTSSAPYLRKFLVNSNTLQSFVTTSDIVNGLIMDGNYLYVFKQVFGAGSTATSLQGTVSRPGCVKIDITGNSGQGSIDTNFFQAPSTNTGTVFYNAVAQDSNYIYLGGNFTKWDNQTANYIVKINKSDAKIASDWVGGTGFNGRVYALLLGSNNSLYASADTFTTYKGVNTNGQIVKLDKQGTRDTDYTSFVVAGGVTTLAEYNSTIIAGTPHNTPTAYISTGVTKSTNLSTFTKDTSFAATGFGLGRVGYINLVGNDLFLSANASTPYQGSVTGFNWTIDKSTGAIVQLGGVPVDTTAPTVTLTSSSVSSGGRSSAAYQDFTATSSELAVNFQVGDIVVTNGTVSNFLVVGDSGGTQRTFRVTPTGYESAPSGVAVTVSIPAGSFTDSAGNQNTASNLFSYTNDQIRPTVNMFDGAGAQLNSESVRTEKQQVSVSFTESVTGFDVSDISVSGATISDFAISSPTAATFSLKNLAAGTVTFSIAEGQLNDLAGNINYSRVVSFTKLPALEIASQSVASGSEVGLNLGLANAASFQIVEEDAYFYSPENWHLLIMYFKSTDGRKVLIGANSDQDFAKNFSSVAPPGTQFLLRKMIIRGENGSMLVIPRASIAGASQIDITLT